MVDGIAFLHGKGSPERLAYLSEVVDPRWVGQAYACNIVFGGEGRSTIRPEEVNLPVDQE